jgi:hypothetical protein
LSEHDHAYAGPDAPDFMHKREILMDAGLRVGNHDSVWGIAQLPQGVRTANRMSEGALKAL